MRLGDAFAGVGRGALGWILVVKKLHERVAARLVTVKVMYVAEVGAVVSERGHLGLGAPKHVALGVVDGAEHVEVTTVSCRKNGSFADGNAADLASYFRTPDRRGDVLTLWVEG